MPDFVESLADVNKYRSTVASIFYVVINSMDDSVHLLYSTMLWPEAELMCRDYSLFAAKIGVSRFSIIFSRILDRSGRRLMGLLDVGSDGFLPVLAIPFAL
jgi:hypothetical protein